MLQWKVCCCHRGKRRLTISQHLVHGGMKDSMCQCESRCSGVASFKTISSNKNMCRKLYIGNTPGCQFSFSGLPFAPFGCQPSISSCDLQGLSSRDIRASHTWCTLFTCRSHLVHHDLGSCLRVACSGIPHPRAQDLYPMCSASPLLATGCFGSLDEKQAS